MLDTEGDVLADGIACGDGTDVLETGVDRQLRASFMQAENPVDDEGAAHASQRGLESHVFSAVGDNPPLPRQDRHLPVIARRERGGGLKVVDAREHQIPSAEEVILEITLRQVDARVIARRSDPALPSP